MDVIEKMRADWNRRAKADAHFYVAFGRLHQSQDEFLASASATVATFEREFVRLPCSPTAGRALEIGCGPGRLMIPMSRHFGQIHGIDVSEEMAALARRNLQNVANAQVHVTSGSDLSTLADGYFDFVYSYTVFQHIPSREVVLNYLCEAKRVLKPGGILCCQLRGTPPLPSELKRQPETWTGCHFTASDMAAFAREHEFPLVAIWGIQTQYMWTTFRKATLGAADRPGTGVRLKAVTATTAAEARVPARGRDAAVSLWLERFPEHGDLAHFPVCFGDRVQMGCYMSSVSENGGCQLDARLPDGIEPGPLAVRLLYGDQPLGDPQTIEVLPAPPLSPRVVAVTDGVNVTSLRIETGGVKVVLEDLAHPEEVWFDIAGRPPEHLQFECKDPITSTYEFAFLLSRQTLPGVHPLVIHLAGRRLHTIPLEVVPPAAGSPRRGKRSLASLLARWSRPRTY